MCLGLLKRHRMHLSLASLPEHRQLYVLVSWSCGHLPPCCLKEVLQFIPKIRDSLTYTLLQAEPGHGHGHLGPLWPRVLQEQQTKWKHGFQSIPAAMWWSVAALTTTGYGDYVPLTTTGKVLGGVLGGARCLIGGEISSRIAHGERG